MIMEATNVKDYRNAGDSANVGSQTQISSMRQAPKMETPELPEIGYSLRDRGFLMRRPSYKKTFSELSTEGSPNELIDIETVEEEETLSTLPAITCPEQCYQMDTGQCTFLPGGGIPVNNPGGDSMQGLQTLSMSNPEMSETGARILQYAAQADGTQPFFLPNSQVYFQAATGEMPAYQIRTPSSAMPQGVVMAAAPTNLHSPQQLAEEATRKREMRLMKNREAAKACRLRKKEYVKCLEIRAAMLEREKQKLIEKLEAYSGSHPSADHSL